MILTIDFGTTVTKVGVWGEGGLVVLARSELNTTHPQVGWAEQDPLRWWTTLVIACAEARAQAPKAFAEVDVVACSGARQTFVPVTWQGDPIGKGILWSDHRAAAEARGLAERMGGDDINRARTGIPLDAGAVAAKLAWLAEHQPERIEAADVILSPRDLVVYRLTDQVVTDATFASRSGLYDFDGNAVRELAGPALGKLPSVVPPDTVVGQLKSVPGAELGLRPGIPVVIGAGGPPVRGPGLGRVGGSPDGELGHHRERVGAGARAAGALSRGCGGDESGRRWLVARGRAVGRRVLPGLAGPDARPHPRRAGAPGRREPAGGARRGGGAVARRCPRPVVARRRPGGFRRARAPRTGRAIWPGR